MDIQQLLYVVRAAEHMNFSKAAELCHATQSCLSQQIAKLEGELGFKLFDRTTRRVSLTREGEWFVQQARKVIEEFDLLKLPDVAVEEELEGELRIGVIGSMATGEFARMMAGFVSRYPRVRLSLVQAGSMELLRKLRDRSVDLAFVTSQPDVDLAGVRTTVVSSFSYYLAVPLGHRLAQRASVKLEELADEGFVFHDPSLAMYGIFQTACEQAGFTPKIVCTATHTLLRYYMIEAGMGIGFFPYEDFLSFPPNRVSRLRIQPTVEPLLVMAVPEDASLEKRATAAFRQFVQAWFRTHHVRLNEVT